jgi:hypothetical protein
MENAGQCHGDGAHNPSAHAVGMQKGFSSETFPDLLLLE